MDLLREMEMRPAAAGRGILPQAAGAGGAVHTVSAGETVVFRGPQASCRGERGPLGELPADGFGQMTFSEANAAESAFYDRLFDSLGELDDKVFAEAQRRLTGGGEGEGSPPAAEARRMPRVVGSMDGGGDGSDESVTSSEEGEAAAAQRNWDELEQEWDEEYAAARAEWTQRADPASSDDEFAALPEPSPAAAPPAAAAQPAPAPGLPRDPALAALDAGAAELLAALRQRIAEGDTGEGGDESGVGEEGACEAVAGGLRFALSGMPRSSGLTGERAAAMQREIQQLAELMGS